MRLRKSLPAALVTAGLTAMLLAGCGSSSTGTSSNSNMAKDQTLKMTWASGGGSADITGLDPQQASDTSSIPIIAQIFDNLVTLTPDLKIEAWGAKSWNVSSDGMTYTFQLRPNQKFSDGTPVKASDYAYGANRAEDPCLQSPVAGYLVTGNLVDAGKFNDPSNCVNGAPGSLKTLIGDSIIADDSANTLTFKLSQPTGYFLYALSYATSDAIEQKVVSGANAGADDKWTDGLTQGATGQGGSGMYYVSKWDHTGNLDLKLNPYWWGLSAGKKPHLTEVDYKIFEKTDTAYSTYQSDQTYAFVDNVPVAQVAAAKGQPDFHNLPILGFGGIAFNWAQAPFDNVHARNALCLAINRELVNQSIAKGTQIPSWHIIPKGMVGYNPNLTGPQGAGTGDNTALAKQEWDKYTATLNGATPAPVKLSFNFASAANKQAADYYQSLWEQDFPGLKVSLDQTAWKQILKDEQQKKLQAYRFGWLADYADAQDFTSLLFSTTSLYNWNNSSVPAADDLMAKADAATDQATRVSDYQQAEKLLVDNGAFCPTSQIQDQYRLRTWVKGMTMNSQEEFPLDNWVNGYIATH